MLIINADDWGVWRKTTDSILSCYKKGAVTSVSAMVFMKDSERAANIAEAFGVDAGLHLNLTRPFTRSDCSGSLKESHRRIVRFLARGKYSFLSYQPFIQNDFRGMYAAQIEEFERLYGREPSHIDGHHHMHLCMNMLIGGFIPAGKKVRRSFSILGNEKNSLNRFYWGLVNRRLSRKYVLVDYLFALSQCMEQKRFDAVMDLATRRNVELMTHPAVASEYDLLMSDGFLESLRDVTRGTYAML